MERGSKVNHLSYVGDARVGGGANVGAGVITCNYDGFAKHRTEIGEGAFIGSNAALVAPVSIGAGAMVGAGSTITGDVAADAMAVARAAAARGGGAAAPGFARSRRGGREAGLKSCAGSSASSARGAAAPLLLDGLKRLEYRGYDSAGRRDPGRRRDRTPARRRQARPSGGVAGGEAARRRGRHRPHTVGDARRGDDRQRASSRRCARRRGAQRHRREFPGTTRPSGRFGAGVSRPRPIPKRWCIC